MINPQLQKHMEMCCEKDSSRASTQVRALAKWGRTVAAQLQAKLQSHGFLWETIKPTLLFIPVVWTFRLVFFSISHGQSWVPTGHSRYDETRLGCSFMVLATAFMYCLRYLYQSHKVKKNVQTLEEARAIRHQTLLTVSVSLGCIRAPPVELQNYSGQTQTVNILDSFKENAKMFIHYVEVQTESLQTLDHSIQTIEVSTKFFFGHKSSKHKHSVRLLPLLRRNVDMLLQKKLNHLQQLRTEIACNLSVIPSSVQDFRSFSDDEVISLARFRDMNTVAKQLLSTICSLVLNKGGMAHLREQRCLVDQGIQEAECSRAYLDEALKPLTTSAGHQSHQNSEEAITLLLDHAASLHVALMSLHQQQLSVSRDDPAADLILLQQWRTVSRQLHGLKKGVDDMLEHIMNKTQPAVEESAQSTTSISQSEVPLLESSDPDDVALITSPPMTAVSLVYSDVANPPKPRRRGRRKECPSYSLKSQPSPFELVEELQSHILMMTLPAEIAAPTR